MCWIEYNELVTQNTMTLTCLEIAWQRFVCAIKKIGRVYEVLLEVLEKK